jgi:hypothetical protein
LTTTHLFPSHRPSTSGRSESTPSKGHLPAQPAFVSGAVITNNTFFGSVAPGENGISVELANSDNVSSIGTVVIGTPGNGNIFNTNTKKFISLNNETLSTAGDPVWTGTYVSTKAKVNVNVIGN